MEKYIHAFNLVPGIGYKTLAALNKHFGDWQYAWELATVSDYLAAGLSEQIAATIDRLRGVIDAEREFAQLWEQDTQLIGRGVEEYPPLLNSIPNPPFLLYRKGAPLQSNAPHIAVVGMRVPSSYGEQSALEIAEGIARCGGIVVSGLAFGIDAIAHYGAVKNNMPTVAVLASGLQRITPSSHSRFAEQILATGGTLISEYARAASFKDNFLWRNRIISGMCKATVVIEAGEKSGALITARHALDQNRDVFALVGDIYRPQAQGCLKILNEGCAFPIYKREALLFDLGFGSLPKCEDHARQEFCLVCELKKKPMTTEEIMAAMGMDIQTTNVMLGQLELKKMIRKNKYSRWEVMV